jgi:acyl-CoA thioester hydrolase
MKIAMYTHQISVRFRDLDALNHVNNSVYNTYLEEATIAYLRARGIGGVQGPEEGTILAHFEIDYRFSAVLGDILTIELSVGAIRNRSFEFIFKISRSSDGKLIAEAKAVHVCFNYSSHTSQPIPEAWRKLLASDQLVV